MTAVMRARGPADLIAVIPVLLGFHPRESLVAVVVEGDRQRLGFRVRVDLPSPEHAEAVADQVVAYLGVHEPREVLLVAFTTAEASAAPVVAAVRHRLDAAGIDVGDALRCDGARYWSYLCADPSCCPAEGSPYDPDANELLAEAVYQGVEVLPDREALAERFSGVIGQAREDMFAATETVAGWVEAASGARARDRDPVLLRRGLEAATAFADAFEREPERQLTDEEIATLSVWASLVVVRDVLWARMRRSNADLHLRLWRQVASRVVPPYEPAVLSLAAFAAWLSGSGAQAQCALDRVASVDPSYSMAELVQAALDRCLPPDVWEGLDAREVMRTVPGLE